MEDWHKTASGDDCAWCEGGSRYVPDFEPFDSDDAEITLCRGHVAEYEGLSLDGLDRMKAAQRADMTRDPTDNDDNENYRPSGMG